VDEKIRLERALKKKALGYSANETVEEYQLADGAFTLTKRKVTRKHYPPDVAAARALLGGERDIKDYTDEELEAERVRLTDAIGTK
jgi:hypothetical protein